MTTRRDFLKALSAMAAGVYLAPSIEFDFPMPAPAIDWKEWHFLEYKWATESGLQAFVDGRDVSGFKEIMQKVCGLVRVERDAVSFSSFGHLNQEGMENAGFQMTIPDIAGDQPLVIAMQYKETGAGEMKEMSYDDVYLGWDDGKKELVPNGEALSIQALVPESDVEWADPVPDNIVEVDEVTEHGSILSKVWHCTHLPHRWKDGRCERCGLTELDLGNLPKGMERRGSLLYVDSFEHSDEPLDSREWTEREKWKDIK